MYWPKASPLGPNGLRFARHSGKCTTWCLWLNELAVWSESTLGAILGELCLGWFLNHLQ